MAAAEITTGTLAKHGFVAVFGAIVHALNAHRHGQTKNALDIVALTFISSFSGAMFSFVALHVYGEISYLTLAIAGSGGFLGVEGMAFVLKVVKTSMTSNFKQ